MLSVSYNIGMSIKLSTEHLRQMDAHCRDYAPEEACGILAGRDETVVSVHPAENVLHSNYAYEVNPQDQIRIFSEIYDRDLDDIAYFHSHPVSEPFPSPTDVRQVRIGRIRLVILSLRGPDPEARSFLVGDGEIEEEAIEIIDG
ncbi:MAG TPA: M67 family metallopeptidase [Chloroflexota bacterium]|nr:M67 family metallopeptidase [Chloroflexota bacterium]